MRYFAVIFSTVATLLFGSCNYDTGEITLANKEWKVSVSVANEDGLIEVSRDGLHFNVAIESSQAWSVSAADNDSPDEDAEWIEISEPNGDESSNVLISVLGNTKSQRREATLTIDGETIVTYDIVQSPDTFSIVASPTSMDLEGGEQIQSFNVVATNNFEWEVKFLNKDDDGECSWISSTTTTGYGSAVDDGAVKVTIKQNNDGIVREARIVVSSVDELEAEDGTMAKISSEVAIKQLYYIAEMPVTLTNADELKVEWSAPVTGTPLKYVIDFYSTITDVNTVVKSVDISDTGQTSYSLVGYDALENSLANEQIALRVSAIGADDIYLSRSNLYTYHPYFASVDDDGNYEVSCARHLQNIDNYLNNSYVQTAEIDMTGINDFTPIAGVGGEGYSKTRPEFTGSYDGRSFKIKNLSITHTATGDMTTVGLFGKICGATLSNIILESVDIAVTSGNYQTIVGAIAGYAEYKQTTGLGAARPAKISNCGTTGDSSSVSLFVTAWDSTKTPTSSNALVGGVVGLIDTYNTSTEAAAAAANADGEAPGNKTGATTSIIVENCFNAADIMGFSTAGGIVGSVGYPNANAQYNLFATISRCYNTGNVGIDVDFDLNNPQTQGVGGIVGKAQIWSADSANNKISECWNSGEISGVADDLTYARNVSTGGVIGRSITFGVENSYNRGKIVFAENTLKTTNVNGGGIMGYSGSITSLDRKVENCYNIGDCSIDMPQNKGSLFATIVGYLNVAYPSIINCGAYAVSGYDAVGVNSGITPTEITTFVIESVTNRDTYPSTWDFSDSGEWVMGAAYPELRNNREN